jgi:hypothetical protein
MSKMTASALRILKFALSVVWIMWALSFPNFAMADTSAVTSMGYSFSGEVSGAVGFSFTPATNIVVTQVGYLDKGAGAPIVSFWSDTNYVFASFSLPPGSGSDLMIYSNITMTLLAGQRYTITVQNGAAITFDVLTNFQVAPQLSNYAAQIVSSGAFTDYGSTYYIEGPDFTFTNQSGPVESPDLGIIQASQTNVIVFWPVSPAGFILQQNFSLDSTNWVSVTNAVSTVNGTNQISSIMAGNSFFRLYHP